MSMQKLIEEVTELIEREYGRAGAQHGLTNHSDHESCAIIMEEFQEASQELKIVEAALRNLWSSVMNDRPDDSKDVPLTALRRHAMLGACELIQVAAMAKKADITIRCRQVVGRSRKE